MRRESAPGRQAGERVEDQTKDKERSVSDREGQRRPLFTSDSRSVG
jgi:hypothetical protein